ncbi:MAG: GDP-mannose 4,6-dehydratase [Gammaproteobacteria bacterium]|nr:GDP-mannose 4,6-dehydratase [Gammaproteobacteria bacterium]
MKKALITGITGQDGSYLAELLLEKGYQVHGIIRRSSSFNTGRLMHLYEDIHVKHPRLILHYGDMLDANRLEQLIEIVDPCEIYNLAAQSHVRVSFDEPVYTVDTIAMGTLRLLEAMRHSLKHKKPIRFYQASSSEMFGLVQDQVQNETTPFYPRSPYGCAKAYAFNQVRNYREAYDLHASNGILFNHESPRRGETFVTRKITRGIARILNKKEKKIYLGNLDAKRDWGYAKDYVEAMWLMLQQDVPDDYVIATGQTWRVKDFLERAFQLVNLDWQDFVEIDQRYFRPTEVDVLIGDASKARQQLHWQPKTSFAELVKIMVAADLENEGLHLEDYSRL